MGPGPFQGYFFGLGPGPRASGSISEKAGRETQPKNQGMGSDHKKEVPKTGSKDPYTMDGDINVVAPMLEGLKRSQKQDTILGDPPAKNQTHDNESQKGVGQRAGAPLPQSAQQGFRLGNLWAVKLRSQPEADNEPFYSRA